ncbi:MAG: hypothetical protein LBV52_04270 [Spirochaetaceae bacterium]|jgi:hypothetical protein|nr:hypothetical protein [Spirochaetaceae bacterium]
MALQPIDLQLLFSQLDTISKEVSERQDGLVLKKAINGLKIEKQNELKDHAVHQAQDNDEGIEKAGDRHNKKFDQKAKNNSGKKQGANQKSEKSNMGFYKDPDLGNYVDLSG